MRVIKDKEQEFIDVVKTLAKLAIKHETTIAGALLHMSAKCAYLAYIELEQTAEETIENG